MLKITDLRIDPNSLGGVYLLAEISPSYEYKQGERTTNINGYKYSVALPKLRFEKLSIKVPLEKRQAPLLISLLKITNLFLLASRLALKI